MNIGELLARDDTSGFQQSSVGTAIQQPNMPNPLSLLPDDEITRSPEFKERFQRNLEAMKDPKNLMTGLVFLAGILQGKKPGQSSAGAIAERAVGALGFRGGLDAYQTKKGLEERETKTKEQQVKQAGEYQQGMIGVGKEQVAATRENTAADRATAEANLALQRELGYLNAETRQQIAEMEAGVAQQIAQLKEGTGAPLFGEAEMKVAQDLYKSSLDSENPLTFPLAVQQVLRLKMLTDPRYAPYLSLMDGPPAPAPAPQPSPKGKSKTKTRLPRTATPMQPAAARASNAVIEALPRPGYEGTPYQSGTPNPQTMSFEEYLRQGQ